MSNVNDFIDTIGKDVSETIVPRIERLAGEISTRARTEYGPRVSAFADQLMKDVIDDQSATVRAFVVALVQDLARRYRPEMTGELHTRIVQGGLEITGRDVKLNVVNRETGAAISSLDVPVSVRIPVDPLAVSLQNTTIKLDVLT